MNKVILMGRLTKDPDVRYSQKADQSIAVARYSLAVDRRHKVEGAPEADFIQCVALGKNGEFAEKYLSKGMKICIEGRIQTGKYENNEGQTIYTTEVLVEAQEFCEKKEGGNREARDEASLQGYTDGFVNIPDGIEEELPFN